MSNLIGQCFARCLLPVVGISVGWRAFAQDAEVPLAKPSVKTYPVDDKPKLISLDLHNASSSEIFDEIGRQSSIRFEINLATLGMPPRRSNGFPEIVHSIQVTNAPFWDAVMQACDVAHLHVAGSDGFRDSDPQGTRDPMGIVLVEGHYLNQDGWGGRPLSKSDDGVVAAAGITRQSRVQFADAHPAAGGSCTVGLLAFVDPTLFAVPSLPVELTEAVDVDGNALRISDDLASPAPGARQMNNPSPPRPYVWDCPLRLTQSAPHQRIAKINGKIHFIAAKTKDDIEVDDIQHVGAWTVTADEFAVNFAPLRDAQGSWVVAPTIQRKQADDARWKLILQQFKLGLRGIQLLDADDHPLFVSFSENSDRGDSVTRDLTFRRVSVSAVRGIPSPPTTQKIGLPQKLRWTFVEEETTFDLPFEFTNLEAP